MDIFIPALFPQLYLLQVSPDNTFDQICATFAHPQGSWPKLWLMVSIAHDVQEFIQVKEKEVTSNAIGMIPEIPGLPEILCYSYCYVGLMTGLFYRYRTYHDWLNQPNPSEIPTWKPLLYRLVMMPVFATTFLAVSYICPPEFVENAAFYEKGLYFRLFYMMPVSFVFRLRNYVTWYGAESACITAGLGAYPTWASSKPAFMCALPPGSSPSDGCVAYDYETIRNIDPNGTEFCIKVKDAIHCWNMTVQWWFYQYTYKNVSFLPHPFLLRYTWTMAISAYWHGLRPGYHLSFLTIPLCLVAEEAMEDGILRHLSPSGRICANWTHRLLKMRAYDYVCVGFLLRSFEGTICYWSSVYYCVHVGAVSFLVVGKAMGALRKWQR
uniref:Leukocyte receptor cluster member 4 n=1 Tax=Naja naja TaxID=35670 RepID=A0A8C6X488_NAJNA